MASGAYAGDVASSEAWRRLAEDADAVLVDVRSRAEWSFVGLADLTAIGKQPVLVEWQSYPAMQPHAAFPDQLTQALTERGASSDTPLFFLCRSGGRSAAAAAAATRAGYSACFNISDGFEGRLDVARHRGTIEGWKAAGLPWVQS